MEPESESIFGGTIVDNARVDDAIIDFNSVYDICDEDDNVDYESDFFEEEEEPYENPYSYVELGDFQDPEDSKTYDSEPIQNSLCSQNSTSRNPTSQTQLDKDTPHRKRKGRPSKKDLSALKPTRGSTRKRKCATVMHYDPSSTRTSYDWTKKDKEALLMGLLDVGSEDIAGLKKSYLPHKTESNIKHQIKMWKHLARNKVERMLKQDKNDKGSSNYSEPKRVKNLNGWVKYLNDVVKTPSIAEFALSQVFMFIAEYGVFPPPEESNGIDFRAMYRFIHCMLNGIPPYGLNSATASLLHDCIEDVECALKENDITADLEKHLHEMREELTKRNSKYKKTYENTYKKEKIPKNIEGLLADPAFNPLRIPPSKLENIEFESTDDDEEDDYDEDCNFEQNSAHFSQRESEVI